MINFSKIGHVFAFHYARSQILCYINLRKEHFPMSITVSDCLKLPSLREGVVVAGENGLSSIVNNISVLEITEESQLSAMKDDINNFELCLTSFAGIADNVEAQCKIIQYLAEVGDVGLVIYYVGTIMQEVNPQIIQTANSLDFPIIVMPLNRIDFRYSEAIRDVSDLLFKDRSSDLQFYENLTMSLSELPASRRTLSNLLRIASDTTKSTIMLSDASHLNTMQSSWPVSNPISQNEILDLFSAGVSGNDEDEMVVSEYLNHTVLIFRVRFMSYKLRNSFCYLMDEGCKLSLQTVRQIADLLELMVELWSLDESEMTNSSMVDAIIRDDLEQVRVLSQKHHINFDKFNTLLCVHPSSESNESRAVVGNRLDIQRIINDFLLQLDHPALLNACDDYFVLFAQFDSDASSREEILQELCEKLSGFDCSAAWLPAHLSQMKAMLQFYETYHAQAEKIFPKKLYLGYPDLVFASSCEQLTKEDNMASQIYDTAIGAVLSLPDANNIISTITSYYLDMNCQLAETANSLYLHRNTVKYRLNKVHDALHVHPMSPEGLYFMQTLAGYYRLNHTD